MKLLVVAGFFGSGKTTLITRLAELLVKKRRQRVAVIVNDIGEIGIDDKVMNAYGLKVKELFGGCVCCELGDDLTKTLQTIRRRIKPDIAILEPSGAADPSQILSAASLAKGKIEMLPLIVLVDATQFKLLAEQMPLALRKISYAELILVNKVDAVSRKELAEVCRGVGKINREARMLPISALTGRRLEAVLDTVMGGPKGSRPASRIAEGAA